MRRYVSPNCSCNSCMRLMICACIETSSAETGSSATMKSGSAAMARAMPMRWRWPPENSCGKRSAMYGLSPTTSSNSWMRSRIWALPCTSPWTLTGSPMMPAAVMRGLSDEYGSWKMALMRLRMERNSLPLSVLISTPSNFTSPSVCWCSCRMQRPSVLLPLPLSPTRPSVSPRCIVSDTSSTALTSPMRRLNTMPEVTGKYFFTRLTSTRGESARVVVMRRLRFPLPSRPRGARPLSRARAAPPARRLHSARWRRRSARGTRSPAGGCSGRAASPRWG